MVEGFVKAFADGPAVGDVAGQFFGEATVESRRDRIEIMDAFGDGGHGRVGKLEKSCGYGGERQEGVTHAAELSGVTHTVL